MPKRVHYARGDSTETSTPASESHIPWFYNFGKFVDNPEFFKEESKNGARQFHQSDSHEILNASGSAPQMQVEDAFKFSSIPSERNPPASIPKGIRRANVPVPGFRRASSEVLHSEQNLISPVPSRVRHTVRTERGSEAEEEPPKTLGGVFRRMVSSDQYSRRNPSKEHAKLLPVYDSIRVPEDGPITIATGDEGRFKLDQSKMLPPTVPLGTDESITMQQPQTMPTSRNAYMNSSPAGQVRNVEFRRRNRDSDGEAPKTLGAMLRRMVSFDQPSKKSESGSEAENQLRRGGRLNHRVSIQLSRNSNGYGYTGAREHGMRKW